MHHVLILGAGFGGLELAARLSDSLTDEVHITLIDQNDAFVFGFSKLEILFGRQTRDEVRYPYREISRPRRPLNGRGSADSVGCADPVVRAGVGGGQTPRHGPFKPPTR
jgi:NADH dehydrogenase FAD-containing subunit